MERMNGLFCGRGTLVAVERDAAAGVAGQRVERDGRHASDDAITAAPSPTWSSAVRAQWCRRRPFASRAGRWSR